MWRAIVLLLVATSSGVWPIGATKIAHAANTNYTFSCTTDDINGTTFDDRDYRRVVVLPGDTATITVSNCNYYYASGSVSPGPNGSLSGSTVFTVSGAGTLRPYVAGRYGFDWTFVTSATDTTRPTLLGSIPQHNLGNVSTSRDLLVSFGEYVTPVAGKNITLMRGDGTLVETFSVTDTSKVMHNRSQLQLNPTTDLEANQRYYYVIDAGAVVDGSGNEVSATNTSSSLMFYTTDTIDPTLTSTSPSNGATGVSTTANITLTFSEGIRGGFNKFANIYRASDNALFESVNIYGFYSNGTITINPTGTLAEATSYYVLVDTGGIFDFGSRAYVGLRSTTDLAFTTASAADITAPTVSSLAPTNGATGVATSANFIATFSETVQAVAGKDVVVRQSPSAAVLETIPATDTSRVTISGSQVTINPTANLNSGSTYYVLIDSGAFRDTAGNVFTGISVASTWQFTTTAPASTTTASTSTTTSTSTSTTTVPSTSTSTTAAPISTSATSTTVASSATTTTTSNLGSSTTTTSGAAAPRSSSPLNPDSSVATTIAGGATSTTELVGQSAVSTLPATSTTAANNSSVTPTTRANGQGVTTSSADTSTSVAGEAGADMSAPDAPNVDVGEVSAVVDGQAIRTTVVRSDNAITTIAGTVQVALYGFDADGVSVPVTLDGKLIVENGGSFGVRVAGFAANSPIEAWLLSDPIRLGDFQSNNYGKSTERFIVPESVEPGSHRLVLTGTTAIGKEITMALGLQVRGDTGEVPTSRIVIIAIVTLAFLGLLLPPSVRRRRR
jgi:methionine-rich copper-binding protein CopC